MLNFHVPRLAMRLKFVFLCNVFSIFVLELFYSTHSVIGLSVEWCGQ